MNTEIKRSLYVTLASIFGALFFALLERGLVLIAFLCGVDISLASFQLFDVLVVTLALFFGMWYGIWLGLHWYRVIYETGEMTGFTAGLFRGIKLEEGVMDNSTAVSWNLDDLVGKKSTQLTHSVGGGVRAKVETAKHSKKNHTVKRPSKKQVV